MVQLSRKSETVVMDNLGTENERKAHLLLKRSLFGKNRSTSLPSDHRKDTESGCVRSKSPHQWLGDMSPSSKQANDDLRKEENSPESPTDVTDSSLFAQQERLVTIDGLRNIARELTLEEPRALNAEGERQQTKIVHRITLDGLRTNYVSSHKLLQKVRKPNQLKKGLSTTKSKVMAPFENTTRKDSFDPDGSPKFLASRSVSKSVSLSELFTKRISKSPAPSNESKKKSLIMMLKIPSLVAPVEEEVDAIKALEIPVLNPYTGFLADSMRMRSSEQDPSAHQLEIPHCEALLMHGKLCAVVDQYRQVDKNFDFSALAKADRSHLECFLRGTKAIDGLIQQHSPIVRSLLDCCHDEFQLEGFFHCYSKDNDKVEVGVFNCQVRRQFVVVYHSTTDNQGRHFRSRQAKAQLHPDQPVSVSSSLRDTYFGTSPQLEANVFDLLDQMADEYPFCDVVMTGNSCGGALATIAALRFAISRQMIRVSCNVFGSPSVGCSEFRLMTNSLSNLKVIRVEHTETNSTTSPYSTNEWTHVGHTLVLQPRLEPPAVVYRFDKHNLAMGRLPFLSLRKSEKAAHNISSFVAALELFTKRGLTWMTDFEGYVGVGVRGADDEARQVV